MPASAATRRRPTELRIVLCIGVKLACPFLGKRGKAKASSEAWFRPLEQPAGLKCA